MKNNYTTNKESKKSVKQGLHLLFILLWVISPLVHYSQQQSYTFTTAGATDSLGPTQSQINAAYLSTNLNGSVIVTAGIQSFTIPASGLYLIDISGASGGNPANYTTKLGGLGARMQGQF